MTDRFAQEDVKRTVNTILGGQVTTTFQKAAQNHRLGRKNVSLQRERFNGRKATKMMTCVGDVNGSRAYSVKRFAQVRPT